MLDITAWRSGYLMMQATNGARRAISSKATPWQTQMDIPGHLTTVLDMGGAGAISLWMNARPAASLQVAVLRSTQQRTVAASQAGLVVLAKAVQGAVEANTFSRSGVML